MPGMDFNDAPPQGFELIPANTICKLAFNIRPGGQGDDGWLTASKSSDALMLDCELIVVEGPYAKKRLYSYMTVSGGKQNDKGESIAWGITRATLRSILESARGILPTDMGPEALRQRQIQGWNDLIGLNFLAKIGIEKDKTGAYPDKNKLGLIITPDKSEYAAYQASGPQSAQAAPAWGGALAAPPATAAPAWAQPTPAVAPPDAQTPPAMTPPPSQAPASSPVPSWAR